MSRLPSFFLAGAPKAGTTSLCRYLDQHPRIYMSPIKEPCFFAEEVREQNFEPALRRKLSRDAPALREFLSGPMTGHRQSGIVAEWNDYLRLFANAPDESCLGEASACYLWSRTAPERIAARIPNAKILVMLRDPAERAFSQYLQGVGIGAIRSSFRAHIQRCLDYRGEQLGIYHPFLDFGLYAEQLCRYLRRFGRNVWVGFYEDFRGRPREVLQDVFRFLEVDPSFSPDTSCRYMASQVPRLPAIGWLKGVGVWQRVAGLTPGGLRPLIRRVLIRRPGSVRMDPADRRYLVDFYRDDIWKLANLLSRDLDGWLQA